MRGGSPPGVEGRHVVFFNWRDTTNPEGGGSERYVETMARGLVDRGARVTVVCAAHDEAPADEVVGGVRFVRRGSKVSIYGLAVVDLVLRRLGRVDLVVDVQNGLPFWTRLATRKPVVVLVHHVHREQWPVVYPGPVGKIGWWLESRLAPRVYRRSQYIAVSQATRAELATLRVTGDRVAVVHNGTESPPLLAIGRASTPTLCVVSRLVPHKRVEHAIATAAELQGEFPGLRLHVVGSGWWEGDLRRYCETLGATDLVTFEGQVSELRKHEIYAQSWLQLLPSLKEGWGLVVGEAGSHGVPTVAYAAAGGTAESIVHGRSGLLVDDAGRFSEAVRTLLADGTLRNRLGEGAREYSQHMSWPRSQDAFVAVLSTVLGGRRVGAEDPATSEPTHGGITPWL